MTARALLKTGVSPPLAWSGGARLLGHVSGKRRLPLVLGYHRVVADYDYARHYGIHSSLVSTRTLVRQLEWIARRYEICPLEELDERENSRRKNKPLVAITFDDGYADVYHNAFPVLVKKGMPFTVFASTDYIGGRELFPHDELYLRLHSLLSEYEGATTRLGEMLHSTACWREIEPVFSVTSTEPFRLTRAMLGAFRQEHIKTILEILRVNTELPESVAEQSYAMSWNMLTEMQRAGVLIGCHSKSHAILTNEDAGTVVEEVKTAREILESRLGVPVRHFAYPDGAFNDAVVSAVDEAGYSCAYTVCFHRSRVAPHLTIPRRMLWERSNVNVMGDFSGSIMTCLVNGVFDSNAACARGHQ